MFVQRQNLDTLIFFLSCSVDVFSDDFTAALEAARPPRPSNLKRFEIVTKLNGDEEVILRDVDGGPMNSVCCC